MDFEQALSNELNQISGLSGKVFPLVAQEGTEPPFVIYVSSDGTEEQALDGSYLGLISLMTEIHIVAQTYDDLKTHSRAILAKLQTFFGRVIGDGGPLIKSLTYTEPRESYNSEFGYSSTTFNINVRF